MGLVKGFDRTINKQLLLSIPMFEGIGTSTIKDIAKPHHLVSLTHSPAWVLLSSGVWALNFDGTNDYASISHALFTDLDFTTGDFSGICWQYKTTYGGFYFGNCANPMTWGFYIGGDVTEGLVLKTWSGASSQSTISAASIVSSSVWYLAGFSVRDSDPSCRLYLNGIDVTSVLGIYSPRGATGADFAIAKGVGGGGIGNFTGNLCGIRVWNRRLDPREHMEIFNRERHLFGV